MKTHSTGFLKLAPDIASLDALGARALDDLFGEPPALATADRARRAGEMWRVPLPGTPDEEARQHEKPRGAGTGFLELQRFPSGGVEGLRARFTHPRSSSRAARHWNMICHLQAHGIAAPQLVALAERGGSPFGAESVLITRELEGFVSVKRWLVETRDPSLRRRGLKSLALTIAQILRCGAWLPLATLDGLRIQAHDEESCVALQIVNLKSEQSILRERGLVRSRLPAIAVTQFERGRILSEIAPRRQTRWFSVLAREARVCTTVRERALLAQWIGGGARDVGADVCAGVSS